jgi:hypothetical protein
MEPIFDVSVVLAIAPLVGAALIGAAGSIAGGLIGSAGQSSANQVNREIAREQMEFQERMSNTAHQREVKDLREAGLNPILAAGGSGASSPSGASIAMQNPNADIARGVEKASNSAINYVQNKAALDLLEQQVSKTTAEAQDANLAHMINAGNPHVKDADMPLARRIMAEARKAESDANSAASTARILKMTEEGAKNTAQFEKEVGSDMKYLRPVLETLKTLK